MASATDYFVYVPDVTSAFRLPRSLTLEEVRSTVSGMGHTAVENAQVEVSPDGQTIRFKRVTGGTKGL